MEHTLTRRSFVKWIEALNQSKSLSTLDSAEKTALIKLHKWWSSHKTPSRNIQEYYDLKSYHTVIGGKCMGRENIPELFPGSETLWMDYIARSGKFRVSMLTKLHYQ